MKSSQFIIQSMVLIMMFLLSSCKQSPLVQKMTHDETDQRNSLAVRDIGCSVPGASETAVNSKREERSRAAMVKWYQSYLEQNGINDFSTESLIDNLNNETPVIRLLSVSLLGERKELIAMEQIEEKLQDKSFQVRLAATRALLKMGNKKGIAGLQEFSDVASVEVEAGNDRNLTHLHDALGVLADAGEISAIPHLRKLKKFSEPDKYWLRLGIVRSLEKLYVKDSSVAEDLISMSNDENPVVSKCAFKALKKIEYQKS